MKKEFEMTENKCCELCAVDFRTVSEFAVSELIGAPFPVLLENVVKERFCRACNKVLGIVIPEPDQLTAIVAVLRACDPIKLSGSEVRFLRKSMGWKAKVLAEKLSLTAETVSRFETDKLPVSMVIERLIRAFVCLEHVACSEFVDVDFRDIANMKIRSAFDLKDRPYLRLNLEVGPPPSNNHVDSHWRSERRVAALG